MEILQQLKDAAEQAHRERDLPHDIVNAIDSLPIPPDSVDSPLLARLLQQLEEYDPYADTGCFCGGASPAAVRETLNRLSGKS
jgi:hypothetical protein